MSSKVQGGVGGYVKSATYPDKLAQHITESFASPLYWIVS